MNSEHRHKEKKSFNQVFMEYWPNIRLILETFVVIGIAKDMLPDTIIHNLKETGIGLGLIFLCIIMGILRGNIKLTENLRSITEVNQRIMDERQLLIEKNSNELNNLETEKSYIATKLKLSENYKKIYALNNKAFAHLREGDRENLISNDKEQLRNTIREYCNNINEAFSLAKNTPSTDWHVCIKLFTRPQNNNFKANQDVKNVKVRTFMRDGRGNGNRAKVDRVKIEHFITENTDFLEIFERLSEGESGCFFSNDLLTIEDYKNSSLKRINKDKSPFFKYAQASMDVKEDKWPLLYRSAIVVPICPGAMTPNLEDGTFIGFLCIDHSNKDIFDDIDIDIAYGFADALYDVLNRYIGKYILNTIK